MYISHKYKFVFLRSPKTASSSLSDFFVKNIDDPSAVYTPIDDIKTSGNVNQSIIDKHRKYNKFCHFTLQDLIDENLITEKMISEYTCFSVLRNPIDRQKSAYYFRKKYDKKSKPSLNDYKLITKNLTTFKQSPLTGMQQTDLLFFNNKINGNLWLYEDLDNTLKAFMSSIGVKIKHELPKHKSNIRNKENDIEFDNEVITALKKHFYRDFAEYDRLTGH